MKAPVKILVINEKEGQSRITIKVNDKIVFFGYDDCSVENIVLKTVAALTKEEVEVEYKEDGVYDQIRKEVV